MARGRMLSRTLGSSRRFNALRNYPDHEFFQLLFTLLIPHVDDFGRMSGDSFTIHLQVFPGCSRIDADFEAALQAMHEVQLVTLYVVKDDIWLQVNKFQDHQQGLANRTASKIPDPPADVCQQLPTNVSNYYSRARAELKRTKENLTKENTQNRDNRVIGNPSVLSTSAIARNHFSRKELDHAKHVRRIRFGCQHADRCKTVDACVKLIAYEVRVKLAEAAQS